MKSVSSIVAVVALVVAGCGEASPLEVQSPEVLASATSTGWIEQTFRLFDECAGEWIDFEARYQLFIAQQVLGKHNVLLNRKGNGIGEDTGTEYRYNSTQVINSKTGRVETFQRRIKLVAEGSGDDSWMYIQVNFHYVDGVPIVEDVIRRFLCTG